MELSDNLEKILAMTLEGEPSPDIAQTLSLTEGAVGIYRTTLNRLARYARSGKRDIAKTSAELGISEQMFNNLLQLKEKTKVKAKYPRKSYEERMEKLEQYVQQDLTINQIAKRERVSYCYSTGTIYLSKI